MILDSGICTIFAAKNVAAPGDMPVYGYTMRAHRWYGLLSFETSPATPTEHRTERQTDARIRILQLRSIREDDVVVLKRVDSMPEDETRYRITRAYHGVDEDSGDHITDLTLQEVSPAWS